MPGVNKKRITRLIGGKPRKGPVIYWMSREQRVNDNWALIWSLEQALMLNTPLIVVFALTFDYANAGVRHYRFMLRGLKGVEKKLSDLNIPFRLLEGDPPKAVATYSKEIAAGLIVTDFDPLRIKKEWKKQLAVLTDLPVYEADARNIVPCRIASEKQEFGAYTLRPKIKRLLPEFLEGFPVINPKTNLDLTIAYDGAVLNHGIMTDWKAVEKRLERRVGNKPALLKGPVPGEDAAMERLHSFISTGLKGYKTFRNDPNKQAVSGLSPYLHFGQISAQRIALEIIRNSPVNEDSDAFLEELIIRRELSDNYCHFNPSYDSFTGFPAWAQKTLDDHRKDQREYIYDRAKFESGETHDDLWNAAQREMKFNGTMHGYMRMYWAKKILEWTPSPEIAISTAIYLNDKYQLDGRDTNGYTGIAWSIGGVHDRAWGERPVFGKIRYMNRNGCRRKFDISGYIKKFS